MCPRLINLKHTTIKFSKCFYYLTFKMKSCFTCILKFEQRIMSHICPSIILSILYWVSTFTLSGGNYDLYCILSLKFAKLETSSNLSQSFTRLDCFENVIKRLLKVTFPFTLSASGHDACCIVFDFCRVGKLEVTFNLELRTVSYRG